MTQADCLEGKDEQFSNIKFGFPQYILFALKKRMSVCLCFVFTRMSRFLKKRLLRKNLKSVFN